MTVVDLDRTQAYIHPHHGVALLDGPTVERSVKGQPVLMQPLAAAQAQSWAALLGLPGGAILANAQVHSLVPVSLLDSEACAWARCPRVALEDIVHHLDVEPVDMWIDQIDVPAPAKMLNVCQSQMVMVGRGDDSTAKLSELVRQVADYLTMWHIVGLYGVLDHVVVRRGLAETFEEAFTHGGPFWSRCIAQTYTMRVSGRDLIALLGRVVSVIALSSDLQPEQVASTLELAISNRVRARILELRDHAAGCRASVANVDPTKW